MEDYVDTYLNQLKEKAAKEPVMAVLAGEIVTQEGQEVVYISGAVRVEEVKTENGKLEFDIEASDRAEELRKEHFPTCQTIGLFLEVNLENKDVLFLLFFSLVFSNIFSSLD